MLIVCFIHKKSDSQIYYNYLRITPLNVTYTKYYVTAVYQKESDLEQS